MKKICIILFLLLLGIALLVTLFVFAYKSINISQNVILGDEIILPDRIVYKNSNNQYFEFLQDSEQYDEIIEIVGGSLNNFSENGEIVSQAFRQFSLHLFIILLCNRIEVQRYDADEERNSRNNTG